MKKRSNFSTLTFSFDVPEAQSLNDRLLPLIYAERERDQNGIQRSNYRDLGGWHSQTNLHKSPDFGILVEKIDEAAKLISTELRYHQSYSLQIGTMWSVINPPGSSNLAHIHPGCSWSGVYYVQAPRNSGKIVFTDPRTENIMQNTKYNPNKKRPKQCLSKVRYTPVAGKMLIFPGWLYHAVKPNLSEEEGANGDRVIMSFNLSQKKERAVVK